MGGATAGPQGDLFQHTASPFAEPDESTKLTSTLTPQRVPRWSRLHHPLGQAATVKRRKGEQQGSPDPRQSIAQGTAAEVEKTRNSHRDQTGRQTGCLGSKAQWKVQGHRQRSRPELEQRGMRPREKAVEQRGCPRDQGRGKETGPSSGSMRTDSSVWP